MTNSILQEFARLLAAEPDKAKRSSLIERAKALAVNIAPDEAFEPPVSSLGEYLAKPIPIPPSLVWPTIVVRGELTATLGRAGKGKTTMNINRILKWSCGRPLFDNFKNSEGIDYISPTEPLKVLVIENEGSAGMFHQKLGIMLNNCGDKLSEKDKELIKTNVFIWGDGGYSGLKLDDPALLAQVRSGVEKCSPDVVFVEPFRSLWKGEENSSTDMAVVIDNLIALATDYECGVILSHHERKAGAGEDGELMSAARGSTVLEGAAATMENFQSVVGGDFRELTWSKARYLPPPPPTRFSYDPTTNWYDHVSQGDIENKILLALAENPDDALSISQLCDITGETQTKLRNFTSKLKKDKRVIVGKTSSDGHGSSGYTYRLPTGGEDEPGGIAI